MEMEYTTKRSMPGIEKILGEYSTGEKEEISPLFISVVQFKRYLKQKHPFCYPLINVPKTVETTSFSVLRGAKSL
jgi:hypothetical protein